MPLMRNKSAAPQSVAGAGLAQPGECLEVPERLAASLTGPDWEPAVTPLGVQPAEPAGPELDPQPAEPAGPEEEE